MPIIINADDYGKNEEINQAISEAFEKKYITRTTLMVNMPYTDKAVELAKQKGFSDRIGIHLNLGGMPPYGRNSFQSIILR